MHNSNLKCGISRTSPISHPGEGARNGSPESSAVHGRPTSQRLTVVTLRDPEELAAFIPAWEQLASSSLEPNVFYEPWMLLPAIRAFGEGKNLEFVLILGHDGTSDSRPRLLQGLFPIQRVRSFKSVPIETVRLWRYEHCYLCTPLVRASCAAECLDAFFEWLDSNDGRAGLLDLQFVDGDGPFNRVLVESLNARGLLDFTYERYTRAFFEPASDAEQYLRRAISGRHRKDFRRKRSRLAEEGRLSLDLLGSEGDVDRWIDDFLSLEFSGWKGVEGTAFASAQPTEEFFRGVVREAFSRERLMMMALRVDGKPLAMKCNFAARDGAYAYKIAFDERFARFSPGALLELDHIEEMHRRPDLKWVDSCAAPNHFMIERLWTGRRTIQSSVIAPGRRSGELLVSSLPLIRWIRRVMRSSLSLNRKGIVKGE